MAQPPGDGPVLFCFDGSDGSRAAMKAAAGLISRPVDAVVITIWETVATRLALAGAFAASGGGADLDAEDESFAQSVAEEGALRARESGYNASPMTRESFEGIAKAILETAEDLSARLIVCGQRGRGLCGALCLVACLTGWRRIPDIRSSSLRKFQPTTVESDFCLLHPSILLVRSLHFNRLET